MVTVENIHNYIRIIGTFDNVAKLFYIPKNTGRFDVVLNENFEIYTGDWENRKHLGNYENISLITRDVLGAAIETPFSSFFEAGEWFSKYLSGTTVGNETGAIDVQNPLPVDGDSVYTKDIWVEESIVTNWFDLDGVGGHLINIPFNNLHTGIENNTSDNPKILRIHFNRTINLFQVGIGCAKALKDFSNVSIIALGSGGVSRTILDDSNNNTKYTSKNYEFEPQLANAVRIEFHTNDPITLTNITIQKISFNASRLQAIKPDGTVSDIDATAGGNLKVSIEEFDPSASLPQNLDAFERLRVSSTDQRIDIEFKYDLQPEIMHVNEVTGGTVTHNSLERDVSLKPNNTTTGTKAEFIQKWDNPYTDGNSQLIAITGTPDKSGINAITASVYLRDAIRGIDVEVDQVDWRHDNVNDRNWDCSHIFLMDFQSLKVGKVRFLLDIDGKATLVESIENDNIRAHGYWQDPNQPLVWRVHNTATETITEIGYDDGINGIGFRFRQALNADAEAIGICGTVKSEGGGNLFDIEGLPVGCSTGVTSKNVGTTAIPIISVRAKSLFKGFLNKSILIPKSISIQADNAIHYYFVINGTLTGASWNDIDSLLSAGEFDVAATAISGGKIIHPDYLATGAKNATAGDGSLLGKSVLTGARGASDVITLVAIRTTVTSASVTT